MTTPEEARDELLARIDRAKAALAASPRTPRRNQEAVTAALEAEARWQAGISDPHAASWRDQYRAELENEKREWHSDVIREVAECECHGPESANPKTWLRHVPTGVLIHHHGRSEAGTLAHLADLLGQHKMITETERAAMHLPVCDCAPAAHPAMPEGTT